MTKNRKRNINQRTILYSKAKTREIALEIDFIMSDYTIMTLTN